MAKDQNFAVLEVTGYSDPKPTGYSDRDGKNPKGVPAVHVPANLHFPDRTKPDNPGLEEPDIPIVSSTSDPDSLILSLQHALPLLDRSLSQGKELDPISANQQPPTTSDLQTVIYNQQINLAVINPEL